MLDTDLVDRPGERVGAEAPGLEVELGVGEIARDLEIGMEPQGAAVAGGCRALQLGLERRAAISQTAGHTLPHQLLSDTL